MFAAAEDHAPGDPRWDWAYYVGAGVALASPMAQLPWEFPTAYGVCLLAAFAVVLRGVWRGWRRRGRPLVILGVIGLALNAQALYSWVVAFQVLNKPRSRASRSVTENQLLETVWALEYFKLTRGQYPIEITRLDDELGRLGVDWDYTAKSNPHIHHFYYSRIDSDRYVLRAHGPDAKPFTADDVLPPVSPEYADRVGFRAEHPPTNAGAAAAQRPLGEP